MTSPRSKNDFGQETINWSKSYLGGDSTLPVMDIEERLRAVEKRLLIIAPPGELLAKYPALAEAYREYKLIERLTLGND